MADAGKLTVIFSSYPYLTREGTSAGWNNYKREFVFDEEGFIGWGWSAWSRDGHRVLAIHYTNRVLYWPDHIVQSYQVTKSPFEVASPPQFKVDPFTCELVHEARIHEHSAWCLASPCISTTPNGPRSGVGLIEEERVRQVTVKGYTAAHDRLKGPGIEKAAAVYATPPRDRKRLGFPAMLWPPTWPYKPTPENRLRELVKAGALIAAAIDVMLAAGGVPHDN